MSYWHLYHSAHVDQLHHQHLGQSQSSDHVGLDFGSLLEHVQVTMPGPWHLPLLEKWICHIPPCHCHHLWHQWERKRVKVFEIALFLQKEGSGSSPTVSRLFFFFFKEHLIIQGYLPCQVCPIIIWDVIRNFHLMITWVGSAHPSLGEWWLLFMIILDWHQQLGRREMLGWLKWRHC